MKERTLASSWTVAVLCSGAIAACADVRGPSVDGRGGAAGGGRGGTAGRTGGAGGLAEPSGLDLTRDELSYLTFDPDVTTYEVSVGYALSTLSFTASPPEMADSIAWRGLSQTLDSEGRLELGLPAGSSRLQVTFGGELYVIVITRESLNDFSQRAYIKAPIPRERFGQAVAVWGDTVAVGSDEEREVEVYRRGVSGWRWEATLTSRHVEDGDGFGSVLALHDNSLIIGAPLEDSAAAGVGGDAANNDRYRSGAAYVFVRDGVVWREQAYLKASNPGWEDRFGQSVSIDGDTVVVGAPREDGGARTINGDELDDSAERSGAAYLFRRQDETWKQTAYLKASNSDAQDRFGEAVSVHGDTVAVGTTWEDGAAQGVNGDMTDNSADRSGAVYVFVNEGTAWREEAYLKASNTEARDYFGGAVSVHEDTLAVGAPQEDSSVRGVNRAGLDNAAPRSGAAYVFLRDGDGWRQEAYVKASNTGASDLFGSTLSLRGDALVVSATGESGASRGVNGDETSDGAQGSGAVYVFLRTAGEWRQEAYLKASNAETSDALGAASLHGDTLVVGATREDSAATGVGGDEDDNSRMDSGAAYVFR